MERNGKKDSSETAPFHNHTTSLHTIHRLLATHRAMTARMKTREPDEKKKLRGTDHQFVSLVTIKITSTCSRPATSNKIFGTKVQSHWVTSVFLLSSLFAYSVRYTYSRLPDVEFRTSLLNLAPHRRPFQTHQSLKVIAKVSFVSPSSGVLSIEWATGAVCVGGEMASTLKLVGVRITICHR